MILTFTKEVNIKKLVAENIPSLENYLFEAATECLTEDVCDCLEIEELKEEIVTEVLDNIAEQIENYKKDIPTTTEEIFSDIDEYDYEDDEEDEEDEEEDY